MMFLKEIKQVFFLVEETQPLLFLKKLKHFPDQLWELPKLNKQNSKQ